jgi:hypothetical protein
LSVKLLGGSCFISIFPGQALWPEAAKQAPDCRCANADPAADLVNVQYFFQVVTNRRPDYARDGSRRQTRREAKQIA